MTRTNNLIPALAIATTALLSAGCSAALTVSVDVYDGERPIPLAYQIAFANAVLDHPSSTIEAIEAIEAIKAEAKVTKTSPEGRSVTIKTDTLDPTKIANLAVTRAAGTTDTSSTIYLATTFLLCTAKGEEKKGKRRKRKRKRKHEVTPCSTEFMDLRYAVASEESTARVALEKARSVLLDANKDKDTDNAKDKAAAINEIVDRHARPWESRGVAAGGAVAGRVVGTPLFDPMVGTLARGSSPLRRKIRTLDVNRSVEWIPFSRSHFSAHGGNSQFVVVREGHLVFRQIEPRLRPHARRRCRCRHQQARAQGRERSPQRLRHLAAGCPDRDEGRGEGRRERCRRRRSS